MKSWQTNDTILSFENNQETPPGGHFQRCKASLSPQRERFRRNKSDSAGPKKIYGCNFPVGWNSCTLSPAGRRLVGALQLLASLVDLARWFPLLMTMTLGGLRKGAPRRPNLSGSINLISGNISLSLFLCFEGVVYSAVVASTVGCDLGLRAAFGLVRFIGGQPKVCILSGDSYMDEFNWEFRSEQYQLKFSDWPQGKTGHTNHYGAKIK